jgi:hypothetical protein
MCANTPHMRTHLVHSESGRNTEVILEEVSHRKRVDSAPRVEQARVVAIERDHVHGSIPRQPHSRVRTVFEDVAEVVVIGWDVDVRPCVNVHASESPGGIRHGDSPRSPDAFEETRFGPDSVK